MRFRHPEGRDDPEATLADGRRRGDGQEDEEATGRTRAGRATGPPAIPPQGWTRPARLCLLGGRVSLTSLTGGKTCIIRHGTALAPLAGDVVRARISSARTRATSASPSSVKWQSSQKYWLVLGTAA